MSIQSNSLYTSKYTSGNKSAYVALNYTVTPTSGGKATLTWNLRLSTQWSYIIVGELSVKVNGISIYYRPPEDAKSASNYEMFASGTYEVEESPIELYVGAGIYEHEINCFNTVQVQYNNESTWTLTTAQFTNPFTVGKEHSIVLIRDLANCSTVRYEIGTLEGTIEQYTKNTVVYWEVPTVLYEMYPNATMGSGYIHVDTYRDDTVATPDGRYVFLGTMTYPLTFQILDGPKLKPEVRDINPITLALTGDENKFVRFFSNAEFAFNATSGQGTNLELYRVENDPYIWEQRAHEMDTGADLVINNVETGNFIFTVWDGRNYSATKTLEKTLIEYNKLTCNIWRIEATGDGTIKVGIGGDIFSQSFGKVRNTLRVSYRYKVGNGEFSEWQSIDYLNDDPTYELTVTLENLDYRKTYTFEAMAEDKLMTVVSKQLPVRAIPVYDWGRDDFNVNVNFNMNHNTVLRHNRLANNVVLSSSGGFIYFRPLGTDDTSAEVKISPQGNIELTGDILINGQSLKSLLGI